MNPLTLEWVDKADGDFVSAGREMRARNQPNFDASCFHSQQCAGKYLKARLTESGITISRTHDLVALLDAVLTVEPLWEWMRQHLQALNAYAVSIRYPGDSADRAAAMAALRSVRRIRDEIRRSLALAT